MKPDEIAGLIYTWAKNLDEIDVKALWSALYTGSIGDSVASLWKSVPQELTLQFLSIEVLDRLGSASELRELLDSAKPFIEGDVTKAHWRALRMIAGDAETEVETAFWRDFVSDDVLVWSRASAVVAPAVARGDHRYISRLVDVLSTLSEGDPVRLRIEQCLRHQTVD